jgi:hypothetical protein
MRFTQEAACVNRSITGVSCKKSTKVKAFSQAVQL